MITLSCWCLLPVAIWSSTLNDLLAIPFASKAWRLTCQSCNVHPHFSTTPSLIFRLSYNIVILSYLWAINRLVIVETTILHSVIRASIFRLILVKVVRLCFINVCIFQGAIFIFCILIQIIPRSLTDHY